MCTTGYWPREIRTHGARVSGAHAVNGGGSDVLYLHPIMLMPLLAATGIYDPPVMRHGHFIAEPGSFDALYLAGTRGTSLSSGVTLRDRSE